MSRSLYVTHLCFNSLTSAILERVKVLRLDMQKLIQINTGLNIFPSKLGVTVS